MFLIAAVLLGVVTVPLAGGRLGRLRDLRLRGLGILVGALLVQVLVISVVPDAPEGVARGIHLLTYAAALTFVALNLRVRGMWLVGIGGLLNFVVIAANAGVMPAEPSALRRAGLTTAKSGFDNSTSVDGARLSFLGDVFAIPSHLPLNNVFSVGDVAIAAGVILVVHLACRPARGAASVGEAPGLPARSG